jgi:hypothetical protein
MTEVCVEIVSLSGERESCKINFIQSVPLKMEIHSERFGTLAFVAENLFDALLKFRLRLEQDGYSLLCNAARKDAYPSRMVLEMGGGRKVYLLKAGMQARQEDLVDVFGEASVEKVCTVEEQRANYKIWVRSLK